MEQEVNRYKSRRFKKRRHHTSEALRLRMQEILFKMQNKALDYRFCNNKAHFNIDKTQ